MKFDVKGRCVKSHLNQGCPKSEWVAGRTAKSYYQDKLKGAVVCQTPEVAERECARQRSWVDRHVGAPLAARWRFEVE